MSKAETVYVIATGGGSRAFSEVLMAGGASSWFAGVEIPYGMPMFTDCCHGEVWDSKLVSERSAHQLAAEALRRATKCGPNPVGIGFTASLCKKEGERKGRTNEYFMAVCKPDGIAWTVHYVFKRQGSDRGYQEVVCGQAIKNTMQAVRDGSRLATSYYDVRAETIPADYQHAPIVPVFPGSFNPIHEAHYQIYRAAEKQFGIAPIFDVALRHHSKAGISAYEFDYRTKLIREKIPNAVVIASHHHMMVDKKAEYRALLPNSQICMVMGADVYQRVDPVDRDELKMFVFARGGQKVQPHPNLTIAKEKVKDMSSTAIRAAAKVIKLKRPAA